MALTDNMCHWIQISVTASNIPYPWTANRLYFTVMIKYKFMRPACGLPKKNTYIVQSTDGVIK
jgi:hypothetical protein